MNIAIPLLITCYFQGRFKDDKIMKSKIFQVGLLAASIFAVTGVAHAENITIEPLAVESYSKEFGVSAQEAERRLTI